eukprot:3170972-Pyramimonas_sp.AAC.1
MMINKSSSQKWVNLGEFLEGVRPPEQHGETRGTEGCNLRGEVVSRRGEERLVESALPASPLSQEG